MARCPHTRNEKQPTGRLARCNSPRLNSTQLNCTAPTSCGQNVGATERCRRVAGKMSAQLEAAGELRNSTHGLPLSFVNARSLSFSTHGLLLSFVNDRALSGATGRRGEILAQLVGRLAVYIPAQLWHCLAAQRQRSHLFFKPINCLAAQRQQSHSISRQSTVSPRSATSPVAP